MLLRSMLVGVLWIQRTGKVVWGSTGIQPASCISLRRSYCNTEFRGCLELWKNRFFRFKSNFNKKRVKSLSLMQT